MSAALAIVADAAAAGVAGLDGSFAWGDAVTRAPGDAIDGAEVVVALGAAAPAGRAPDARWVSGAGASPAGERLVATAGDGLFGRAAWPVRDELFELEAPDPAADLLVVTADERRDAGLLEKLAGRGIGVRTAAELTARDLAAAAAVAFPPAPDDEGRYVPGERAAAVPGAAFAALAARRPLIAPRAEVTFGLHAGVDHLAASTDDDVVQYADALRALPGGFALQVALGRIAAERQRASTLYGRLVGELRAARRSAAPSG